MEQDDLNNINSGDSSRDTAKFSNIYSLWHYLSLQKFVYATLFKLDVSKQEIEIPVFVRMVSKEQILFGEIYMPTHEHKCFQKVLLIKEDNLTNRKESMDEILMINAQIQEKKEIRMAKSDEKQEESLRKAIKYIPIGKLKIKEEFYLIEPYQEEVEKLGKNEWSIQDDFVHYFINQTGIEAVYTDFSGYIFNNFIALEEERDCFSKHHFCENKIDVRLEIEPTSQENQKDLLDVASQNSENYICLYLLCREKRNKMKPFCGGCRKSIRENYEELRNLTLETNLWKI